MIGFYKASRAHRVVQTGQGRIASASGTPTHKLIDNCCCNSVSVSTGLGTAHRICGGLRNSQTTREMEIGKAATSVMLQPSALCERAYSVDTCTVAALDAIAAFASQTPAPPRRVSRFFRVWLPCKSPCRADHSAYVGLASFISPILSAVDADQAKQSRERCQRETHAKSEISVNGNVENAVRFRSLRSPTSFPFCPTRTLCRRDQFPRR